MEAIQLPLTPFFAQKMPRSDSGTSYFTMPPGSRMPQIASSVALRALNDSTNVEWIAPFLACSAHPSCPQLPWVLIQRRTVWEWCRKSLEPFDLTFSVRTFDSNFQVECPLELVFRTLFRVVAGGPDDHHRLRLKSGGGVGKGRKVWCFHRWNLCGSHTQGATATGQAQWMRKKRWPAVQLPVPPCKPMVSQWPRCAVWCQVCKQRSPKIGVLSHPGGRLIWTALETDSWSLVLTIDINHRY